MFKLWRPLCNQLASMPISLLIRAVLASSPLDKLHGVIGAMPRALDSAPAQPQTPEIHLQMRSYGSSLAVNATEQATRLRRGMITTVAIRMRSSLAQRPEHGSRHTLSSS